MNTPMQTLAFFWMRDLHASLSLAAQNNTPNRTKSGRAGGSIPPKIATAKTDIALTIDRLQQARAPQSPHNRPLFTKQRWVAFHNAVPSTP
jgi:hypothetical protein